MTTELFKSLTSAKGIAFLLVAWGLPVATVMALWWLLTYPDWTTIILPAAALDRIKSSGLAGGWLFFIVWTVLTLALGLNARLFFRLYEGYLLPRRFAARRRRIHWLRRECARLDERHSWAKSRVVVGSQVSPDPATIDARASDAAAAAAELSKALGRSGRGLSRLPWRMRLNWRDYPTTEKDMLPTLMGNRIRAFERYGNVRFGLDLLILWYEFVGVADEKVREELTSAREGVEIFLAASVCFLGLSLSTLIPLLWIRTWQGVWWPLPVAAVFAAAVSAVAYRKAVSEIAEWGSAVSALVNTHRGKVAEAFGFAFPETLADERRMWQAVNGFVRTGGELWDRRLDAVPRTTQTPATPPTARP
jgi:hypothetical protein